MKTTDDQRTGRGSGGASGRGFQPGQSGNPGGRPKSLAAQILAGRPTTSKDLVALWALIAFGAKSTIKKKYGLEPDLRDRMEAARELANRLHGKPMQTHEISGVGGGPIPYRSMNDTDLDRRVREMERQLKRPA